MSWTTILCRLFGHRWDDDFGGLCTRCWDSPDHVEKDWRQ